MADQYCQVKEGKGNLKRSLSVCEKAHSYLTYFDFHIPYVLIRNIPTCVAESRRIPESEELSVYSKDVRGDISPELTYSQS